MENNTPSPLLHRVKRFVDVSKYSQRNIPSQKMFLPEFFLVSIFLYSECQVYQLILFSNTNTLSRILGVSQNIADIVLT
jgi:hypothetical protein